MSRSSVRLKDIADKTGFSVNTVSLALRDSPRIPDETRQLIRKTADALNYLPNHIAKSLVSRETKTIGLILTDELMGTMSRFPSIYGASNSTDAACLATSLPPVCTDKTLVANATATSHMWASDRLIGPLMQSQMGSQAATRASNNPF